MFVQGVASGDPRGRSVVLWTRCTPTRPDVDAVLPRVEVSTQADFSAMVATVPLHALRGFDYTTYLKNFVENLVIPTCIHMYSPGPDLTGSRHVKT